ncbi:MAG: hypothetical protein WC510_07655 [Candidatus Omnitrophota bacterium]
MGKKESIEQQINTGPAGMPNIAQEQAGGVRPKIADWTRRLFAVVKLILGLCLLPFVFSVSTSFINEFGLAEQVFQDYFWSGVLAFIILYLFVYEPAIVYNKGQRILEAVFSFFKPLVRVAPYLLPIYTIIIFIGYLFFSSALKSNEQLGCILFLLSFTLAFHIVFSAKSIRSKQSDFLKANYIFGFSFIYIIDIVFLVFFLNIIFAKLSFVDFINRSFQDGKDIFYAIFRQLFL